MKKVIFALLLMLPLTVFAAEPKVLTVSASANGGTVSYTGTTEDGLSSVMCRLIDKDGEVADRLSTAVENNEFVGSFTNVSNGEYEVACARYEGGDVVKNSVTVVASATQTNNPQTNDPGIGASLIILGVSVAGIVGATVYLKKRKTNKE